MLNINITKSQSLVAGKHRLGWLIAMVGNACRAVNTAVLHGSLASLSLEFNSSDKFASIRLENISPFE